MKLTRKGKQLSRVGWTQCPLRGLCRKFDADKCIAICGVHCFWQKFKRYWLNEMAACFHPAPEAK
jgi:hypothetical protein